jgi:hypothetical protein
VEASHEPQLSHLTITADNAFTDTLYRYILSSSVYFIAHLLCLTLNIFTLPSLQRKVGFHPSSPVFWDMAPLVRITSSTNSSKYQLAKRKGSQKQK